MCGAIFKKSTSPNPELSNFSENTIPKDPTLLNQIIIVLLITVTKITDKECKNVFMEGITQAQVRGCSEVYLRSADFCLFRQWRYNNVGCELSTVCRQPNYPRFCPYLIIFKCCVVPFSRNATSSNPEPSALPNYQNKKEIKKQKGIKIRKRLNRTKMDENGRKRTKKNKNGRK